LELLVYEARQLAGMLDGRDQMPEDALVHMA
jgi:hypothetical protein